MVFAYDPELASTVATPPATIPEVIRIMQTIDRLCIAADGLKWFNQIYLDVTNAVGARVAAVATGWHSLEELRACRPEVALADLSDAAPLLALWN